MHRHYVSTLYQFLKKFKNSKKFKNQKNPFFNCNAYTPYTQAHIIFNSKHTLRKYIVPMKKTFLKNPKYLKILKTKNVKILHAPTDTHAT